jgi:hypothetical protein
MNATPRTNLTNYSIRCSSPASWLGGGDLSGASRIVALASWLCAFAFPAAAAVQIIGVQYQPDYYFPEFNCYWNASAYPGPCRVPVRGATVHVYVKNTGPGSVTLNDANWSTASSTYSLKTIIKRSTSTTINPQGQNSIYFYWDNPPQDVLDAGEPVWYRSDPSTLPAGGVGQVALRLRTLPPDPVKLQVVTSAGNLAFTNVTVDANTPRVAGIGYSEDLRRIYIHWRRDPAGSGAPTSVWLDGTNVTALTTTVGDPALNFAASVITLPSPLPYFSYHVFQGVYADGKTAAASQRAWTNKFIYTTYCKFDNYDCNGWLQEAMNHGFNNIQMNLCGMCLDNSITSTGYGYTIMTTDKLNPADPDMWFLDDEPDIGEYNQVNTHCGTGLRIPCGTAHSVGTLVMKRLEDAAALRSVRPNVPTTVNLDGSLEPESFFTWGGAVDILQTDNYYEPRLKGAYLETPNRIPLFAKAEFSYAVARTCSAGAEPNPSNHLLYSTRQTNPDWPYPSPQSKRFEVYYSLAGGSKGMGYWWLKSPNGLNNTDAAGRALWKEMGLCGNEIKTARNLIVKSTPVDLPLTPSADVWARAVASGVDTLILYVVNDNYANDITGCHVTNVPNASVTLTLPSWMQTSPVAFEITAGGLRDVSTVQNGSQLQVNLGTLALTRMIVITTDVTLRTAVQARYDSEVRSRVCAFAPELCTNSPPTITQQPVNRSVAPGGTTNFTTVASGSGTLGYRWQKAGDWLSNGGHYSGATTGTLTISNADTNDAASYRCVVTNAYGSVTSAVVTLTLVNPPGVPVAAPATSITDTSFTANWNSASNATGYRLDVATDAGFSGFVSGYNNLDVGNVLNRVVSGLTGATPYYYRVRAYNGVGTSGNSGTISVTTTATLSPPATPVAAAASGVTGTSFTANWSSAVGADGYRLDVSTNAAFANFLAGFNNLDVGSALSRNVTGLAPGETYYYRVRAYNGAGASGNSATIAVTLATADPCVVVSNRDFEGGFSLAGGGYIADGWTEWETDPGGVVGYDETALVHGGGHSQRLRVWGGTNGTSGGVYQQVPVVAGQPFHLGVWAYAGDELTTAYLGADPAGGTNPNAATVVWSAGSTTVGWVPLALNSTATASQITVFLKVVSTDNAKRNAYFDDAIAPACSDQPPGIVQQPEDQSVVAGSQASFIIAATGTAPLSYQWQKNEVNLNDDAKYSGTLTPMLTLTGVDNSDEAEYRCVVTNAFGATNSDAALLRVVIPNPCLATVNPGFEDGFSLAGGGYIANGWFEWETDPDVVIGYDETSLVHGGAHAQRIRVWGGPTGSSGGVYQSVPVVPGDPYSVSVWMYAGDPLTECSLGVDPTGGFDPDRSVEWSAPSTNAAWVQRTWTGTAATDSLTVFLKVSTSDSTKRNGYFDDLTPSATSGPLQLLSHWDGAALTLIWPECPGAHLERTDSLAPPVTWSAVTNPPVVTGGQKRVTITPTGNAGYFRLVPE